MLRLHETLPYGMAPAPIPELQRLCFLSPAFFLLQVLRLLQRLQRFQPADYPAEQIQQGQLPQPMHPPSLRPNCFQRVSGEPVELAEPEQHFTFEGNLTGRTIAQTLGGDVIAALRLVTYTADGEENMIPFVDADGTPHSYCREI